MKMSCSAGKFQVLSAYFYYSNMCVFRELNKGFYVKDVK